MCAEATTRLLEDLSTSSLGTSNTIRELPLFEQFWSTWSDGSRESTGEPTNIWP